MHSSVRFLSACVAVLLGGAGCTVGPDYQRPATAAPSAWKEPAAAPPAAPVGLASAWWRLYQDPILDAIVARVVAENQEVRVAAARVAEARARLGASRAAAYPRLDGAAGSTRRYRAADEPATVGEHRLAFDLGYELDLWGRTRRAVEAGAAELRASDADRHAVLLAVTAEAARNYHLLRALDEERAVVEATAALRRDTLALQEARAAAGLINAVDVTRARTELASVEAELHALARQRAQLEHALAVLGGQAPAGFAVEARAGSVPPPPVPAGLPSALLERRPDLVAAEQGVRAASARIGVAQAERLPSFRLTGQAGLASADLRDWLESPSRLASFGPAVTVPLFDAGRTRAEVEAAQARHEQSVAVYRARVLQAFREVEDALSDLSALGQQDAAVARALAAARDTARLAEERYGRGLTNYLDVVDAQRAVLQAERQDAQLRGQRLVATTLLAKALGGGWSAEAPLAMR
ncbi:MAG: efflux transporter outer membrane subunit [Opitutaceae bacterium]|nr:efflux transporter outer membrane subunit [Opitutaceae bacterium]